MTTMGAEHGGTPDRLSDASTAGRKPLQIVLAASGGGHVRQILDLAPFWHDHHYSFVTEDTALGQSIAAEHPTDFVAHYAWGQARLGGAFRMLAGAVRNATQSLRAVRSRRPDVVITTGAGSMLFTVLFGRLHGAKIILIDSFARFERPSLFARMAGRFAHVRIAQSAQSARNWPGALCFDPFRYSDEARPDKEPLLFATVGATLPFDRLVRMVAGAKAAGLLPETVIVQCGEGGLKPDGVEAHETLPFERVKSILHRADIVVCHGGTGSIITALREGCRVIAVPRRFARGEHYDDHQAEITGTFAERGLLVVADGADDNAAFADALAQARAMTPRRATTDPAALIDYLRGFADTLAAARG